jgi:hypothetical protein
VDRKEVVDAIAPNESMHAALMNLISNNDDFTTFVTMTRKATGTDAQKFVESYVKVGGVISRYSSSAIISRPRSIESL